MSTGGDADQRGRVEGKGKPEETMVRLGDTLTPDGRERRGEVNYCISTETACDENVTLTN